MSKKICSIYFDADLVEMVQEHGEKEHRAFSQMVGILVREALEARKNQELPF